MFHHKFEYLVILTNFEYLNHILFILLVKSCIIISRLFLLLIWFVLRSLIRLLTSMTKLCSFSLFLTIVCFLVWITSLNIKIFTIKGVWSKNNFQYGRMEWLLNSSDISLRDIKLMTKSELSQLSVYLVGTWTVRLEMPSWKKSAISVSIFLWIK